MAHERRIHPRVKCPVTYQVAIEEYPDIMGKVLNLSLGGITFVFPEKLNNKSVLNFVVTCPVTPFNLDAHGEIIWSKNATGKDNFVSGAIFPYLSEDEVLQLRRVLAMFSSKVEEDRRQEERRLKLALIEKDLRRDQRRKKAR